MLQYTSKHKVTIPIDGESIRVVIARIPDGEFRHVATIWNAIVLRQSRPIDRRPGEDDGLTDVQVLAKRDAELSLEQRAEQRARARVDDDEEYQFTKDTITKYVTFEPDQVFDDGAMVVDGEAILRTFGSRSDVLGLLMTQVILQNKLTETQKKTLQSRFDSASTSLAPETPAGEKPAPIATPVAPPAIAPIADAMGETATTSSGTTDPSS